MGYYPSGSVDNVDDESAGLTIAKEGIEALTPLAERSYLPSNRKDSSTDRVDVTFSKYNHSCFNDKISDQTHIVRATEAKIEKEESKFISNMDEELSHS